MRDNLSGSFQFNSGEDKQQILYGSDQTTCPSLGSREEEEPHYAEIAEVHAEVHKQLDTGTLPNPFTTLPMFESTTLVTNVGSTLGRGRTRQTSLDANVCQDRNAKNTTKNEICGAGMGGREEDGGGEGGDEVEDEGDDGPTI